MTAIPRPLNNISIVLQQPRHSENIGSAARAMHNMGLEHLVVVAPANFDAERVATLATHAVGPIVNNITFFDDLPSALAPFGFVAGTTARLGGQRRQVETPARAAPHLMDVAANNRVALVFGPEDRGLTNLELRLCHILINIPTADFASLNLAQAVMVMCYELQQAARPSGSRHSPRLATRHELDGMYDQLREILVRINYINAENPDYWLNKLRRFFTRLQLRASDVSMIRGICRQVDWYGRKCFEDGREQEAGCRGQGTDGQDREEDVRLAFTSGGKNASAELN